MATVDVTFHTQTQTIRLESGQMAVEIPHCFLFVAQDLVTLLSTLYGAQPLWVMADNMDLWMIPLRTIPPPDALRFVYRVHERVLFLWRDVLTRSVSFPNIEPIHVGKIRTFFEAVTASMILSDDHNQQAPALY